MLAANQALPKRLAEIDKSLLQHDTALRDDYRKLLLLLKPLPDPPERRKFSQRPAMITLIGYQKRVLDSLHDYFRCA